MNRIDDAVKDFECPAKTTWNMDGEIILIIKRYLSTGPTNCDFGIQGMEQRRKGRICKYESTTHSSSP